MFYYDVYPQMVPADQVSVIRIRPRFAHAAFSGELKVFHSPYDRTRPQYEPEWHLEDDTLVIKATFESEQEHLLQVVRTLANGKVSKLDFVTLPDENGKEYGEPLAQFIYTVKIS